MSLLQWPAMVATLVSVWLIASRDAGRRKVGFWISILSNLLWTAWGIGSAAYALVLLQVGLFILNVRGARKSDEQGA